MKCKVWGGASEKRNLAERLLTGFRWRTPKAQRNVGWALPQAVTWNVPVTRAQRQTTPAPVGPTEPEPV